MSRLKTLSSGKDAAGSPPDQPSSSILRDCRRHSGRKSLFQRADAADLDVSGQATWGMSVEMLMFSGYCDYIEDFEL